MFLPIWGKMNKQKWAIKKRKHTSGTTIFQAKNKMKREKIKNDNHKYSIWNYEFSFEPFEKRQTTQYKFRDGDCICRATTDKLRPIHRLFSFNELFMLPI